MKSLSAKTFQCGVTVQGLTTLSGTVYLTALTNTATWDYVVVGTTAQGQLYTRTYAQLMSDITSGIGLSGYVPTSRTLTINGVSYDLTANRSWTISTVDYTSRLQHQVKAGVAINKGQAVYVTSADGTNMIVGLASNASEATSSKTMGLLDATVSTNGFANVVTEGLLAGLDTSAAGTEGDPVWLGTGGNLIYGLINKPYAPAHLVFIGIVTRKNSNNGEIFVKVQNGFELKEIHDVDLITTAPINGHLLGYNGTLWVNKTIAGWLGYTPANASGTTNYISKFTGSTTLGNSQVFDDGTNVGIGTTTMFGKLSISSGNSNGIRIDTNGGGYSALNIGGTGSLTVDAPGITGGRFQITDSGNVGIGNPSPSFKVHIKSSGLNSYPLVVQRAANTNNIFYIYEDGSGNGTLTLENSGGGAAVSLNSSGSSYLTGGNVGIGTTSPSQKLDVNGYAKFTSGIILDGGATSHYREFIWNTSGFNRWDLYVYGAEPGSNVGGDLFLARYADNGAYISNTVTFQRSTGNVGIGTSNPSYQLQITAAAANDANFLLDGTDRDWLFQSKTGTGLFNIFDNTASASRLAIDSSGNVGIGTTSPSYKLDVNGSFNAVTSGVYLTYNSGIIYHGSSYYQFPSGSYYYLYGRTGMGLIFGSNNAEVGRFDLSGNLGIGTTSPGYKLEVNGIIKSGIAGNSSANYAALVVASAGTTTSQAAIAIQQLTSEGDTIIFGDYEPYVEYNFMHENASNVFHIHSGENTNSLGSNTFYNRSGNPRTGYIKWSLYQGNGDMHVGGSVGIGNTSPSTKLDVSGVITATGGNSTNWNTAYGWGNHASASYVPQARTLTINGTTYDLSANRTWTISTATAAGSDTQVQYNSSGSLAGASALTYNSTTNRVGINQAFPGYDLDVNGQVRVQDKLRVGTGNGVVHMSSTATINPSATTVVWAQTVSVGMCAFIEYYILNNNSLTDQRAGTIMVTWNQSGTPTITHTETTTPDIGSTTTVNFTSSLVGSDARINAVNSSANPYTMVMSYKYF